MVVAPAMYKNFDFDPVKSFAPVANVAEGPLDHGRAAVPAGEFDRRTDRPCQGASERAELRLRPGHRGRSSSASGKVTHGPINSVPYRGGAQAITDMLGGRIQLNIGTTATLTPLVKEGKLKAISAWSPSGCPSCRRCRP